MLEQTGRDPTAAVARVGRTGSGERVQSVERATTLIDCLLSHGAPLTTLELSRRTGLNRTIVHRLLQTMQDSCLVEEAAPGRYYLGPTLLLYGQGFVDRLPFRRAALPYTVYLGRQAVRDRPWVVALAVPVGSEAVLIDRIWHPNAPLDTILDVGTRLPMTGSAHGRAMLSRYSPEDLDEILGTRADEQLHSRLQEIRENGGLSASSGERLPGVSAICVAVTGSRGVPIGSIGISGINLEQELTPDSEVARQLLRTASAIEQNIPR